MSAKELDRIIELWPLLPEATQADLLRRVETVAAITEPLQLKAEDVAAIERGREDFKHGRTLSLDQFEVNSAAFMANLRSKQRTT